MASNWGTVVLVLAVIVAGSALMHISQKVHEKQKKVQYLGREIVAENWAIRALNAEWAYLSRRKFLTIRSSSE